MGVLKTFLHFLLARIDETSIEEPVKTAQMYLGENRPQNEELPMRAPGVALSNVRVSFMPETEGEETVDGIEHLGVNRA